MAIGRQRTSPLLSILTSHQHCEATLPLKWPVMTGPVSLGATHSSALLLVG